MRRSLPCLALLAALLTPSAARAQTDYYARAGATYSTMIVRDVLFEPVHVQPGLAPTLFVGAALPFGNGYRMGIEASLGRASLSADEELSTDPSEDLGSYWHSSALLNLEGPVRPRLRWRAGIGLLRYSPDEREGIFAQGGTTRALFGAGLDYRAPALAAFDLMLSARYDYHRFSTDELRARGFTLEQAVQRVSLSVGLARSAR